MEIFPLLLLAADTLPCNGFSKSQVVCGIFSQERTHPNGGSGVKYSAIVRVTLLYRACCLNDYTYTFLTYQWNIYFLNCLVWCPLRCLFTEHFIFKTIWACLPYHIYFLGGVIEYTYLPFHSFYNFKIKLVCLKENLIWRK